MHGATRYGIELVDVTTGTQTRRSYYIVDLLTWHRVGYPDIKGLVLRYDSLARAQARCDELNQRLTGATDRLPAAAVPVVGRDRAE